MNPQVNLAMANRRIPDWRGPMASGLLAGGLQSDDATQALLIQSQDVSNRGR